MRKRLAFGLALGLLWAGSQLSASQHTGAELVKRLGCMGCHSLAGKGGQRGPAWDGVGARLSPEALRQQIVSPKGRMPNFAHLKAEELQALVDYLSQIK